MNDLKPELTIPDVQASPSGTPYEPEAETNAGHAMAKTHQAVVLVAESRLGKGIVSHVIQTMLLLRCTLQSKIKSIPHC